ncbi:MAG: radical SAM protein [Candidatus Abyssobacteria bacterium SURF_17]|uniref:Radical SAM protein n=1 Tax=Candidatus Abyssobacteria bacterium SURF_17 TaxID=2093361 RepID=A0A419F6Q6_9BACT|nr:MAG: radical SAM protein [Candidatus Abyssubacteria bacterium SURF_17]
MKILLLNPQPGRDVVISRDHMGGFGFEVKSTNITPPLNLAYCAAVLEGKGHEAGILDAVALGWKPHKVMEWLRQREYGLVLVNTATPSIADDLSIATAVKRLYPRALVALLGPHVSVFSEQALRQSQTDAVIRGEPEHTVGELADAVARNASLQGIQGLTVNMPAGIEHYPDRPLIEDLDSLPFPARHLLPMERYRSAVWGRRPFTTMLSSRGCSYGCAYCPYRVAQGTKWRGRSSENVVNEIEECVTKYGVREILFRDPLFTADPERAVRISKRIVERGIRVDWRCETRADLLTEEMIDSFARAGCKEINFGLESANIQILRDVRRMPISWEQVRTIFEKCRREGIETMAFFILGLPGETEHTIEETVEFALKLNPDVAQFTAATPYPNTPYYEQLKHDGLLHEDWSVFTSRAPVVGTRELGPERLQALIHRAYRRFYLRPRYVLLRLRRLRSLHEVTRLCRGAWSAIRYSGIP